MQLHKRTSEPSPACLKINLATLCLQTVRIVTSHFLIYMTLNFYECMMSIHPKPPPAQTNSALRAHLRLSVDQQLPDRQAAANEAGKYIKHPYDQHWSSSGLCSLPTALLPVHQRLCNPPGPHTATTRRSGSRTRDSGAGGGRSNKERQRLQPLASVARAPLFEVRRVRFTHSPYWHS